MRISVIVPSYKRPADLRRCLEALSKQTMPPLEVLAVARVDDAETRAVIAAAPAGAHVREVLVDEPGVIAAMQAGLDAVDPRADVVALTDDDAAPRPDWIARLAAHFVADENVVGVGGRDWQWYDGKVNDDSREQVGIVQWFGRVIGNHHLGVGPPREVDILKGANCAFRRPQLQTIGFDHRLRGDGAQVHWEMALCLPMRRRGWKLLYDPAVAVDHYPAPRADADVNNRGGFHAQSFQDAVFNETLVMLEHLQGFQTLSFGLWCGLVGTATAPGLGQLPRTLRRSSTLAIGFNRLFSTWAARAGAVASTLHRHAKHSPQRGKVARLSVCSDHK